MRDHDLWGVSRKASGARPEAGAASVEFAIILIPFLTLVFGMIQYGLYFYSAQTGSQVANTAIRQLSVGNCTDPTNPLNTDPPALQSYVKAQLGSATSDPAGVTETVEYWDVSATPTKVVSPNTPKLGDTVKLTLTFPTLNMHFPFVPFLSSSTVSRTVEARLEDMSSAGCPA